MNVEPDKTMSRIASSIKLDVHVSARILRCADRFTRKERVKNFGAARDFRTTIPSQDSGAGIVTHEEFQFRLRKHRSRSPHFETLGEAAERLLKGMDERKRLRDPAPTVLEKRPEPSKRVGVIAQGSGQYATEGENGSDPVALDFTTGNGLEKRGQVVVSRKCWPAAEGNTGRSIACPHHDADTVDSLFSMPVLNGNAHRSGGE